MTFPAPTFRWGGTERVGGHCPDDDCMSEVHFSRYPCRRGLFPHGTTQLSAAVWGALSPLRASVPDIVLAQTNPTLLHMGDQVIVPSDFRIYRGRYRCLVELLHV